MTIFYCAGSGGFYLPGMQPTELDCVEIASAEHLYLREQQSLGKLIQPDAGGWPVAVDPPFLPPTTDQLCERIDKAADIARAAVVGDPTRTIEYERAAAEAAQYKAAGYPTDNIPRTVVAWAINGRTAQQAADDILAEAAAYTEALYQIRETRLQAKGLVRQAMEAGNTQQAQDIAAATIVTIHSAVAGVGNAQV